MRALYRHCLPVTIALLSASAVASAKPTSEPPQRASTKPAPPPPSKPAPPPPSKPEPKPAPPPPSKPEPKPAPPPPTKPAPAPTAKPAPPPPPPTKPAPAPTGKPEPKPAPPPPPPPPTKPATGPIGKPEPKPAPSTPSAPVCGAGLQCSGGSVPGANACRQQPTSSSVIYCCPPGQSVSGGRCAAPAASTPPPASAPLCGSGLQCDTSNVQGASACRRTPSSATIYCCPPGQSVSGGRCAAPAASTPPPARSNLPACPASGAACAPGRDAASGGTSCAAQGRPYTCCAPGMRMAQSTGGRICTGAPACAANVDCWSSPLRGGSSCVQSTNSLAFCCPPGHGIIDGMCQPRNAPASNSGAGLLPCPTGAECRSGQLSGGTACRSSSGEVSSCCGSNQRVVAAGGVMACQARLPNCDPLGPGETNRCAVGFVAQGGACLRDGTVNYCCPRGQQARPLSSGGRGLVCGP